jgi:nucleoside-diphosphate kinase
MQVTLVLLKPDTIERRLAGEVLRRFEQKGLLIRGLKMLTVSRALAEEHYAEHRGKPFCEGLIEYITSGPLIALALEGREAISVCRRIVGATDGAEAAPGTIRGEFALSRRHNLVHASDGPESARRELALFFREDELQFAEAEDMWVVYDVSDLSE